MGEWLIPSTMGTKIMPIRPLVRGNLDGVERDKIRKGLPDHCGQDVRAMKLVERLQVNLTGRSRRL